MSKTLVARLAAFNAYTAAVVARSEGKATKDQVAFLASIGSVPTKRQAESLVKKMIADGGF